MSERPLCPMKFALTPGNHPPDAIDWQCEGETCSWWSKGGERCAVVTIAMGFWAILDCIKVKEPSKRCKTK